MSDIEQNNSQQTKADKAKSQSEVKRFLKRHSPVLLALTATVLGSFAFGYMVGHRQGLTVVGFAADAEQLNEVVQKQKAELETLGKRFNSTVQERDVAVSNANKFYQSFNEEKARTVQVEGINQMYRDLLKTRGGVSLTVHNLAVTPLPDNAYEYVLDLVHVSENNRQASGNIEIRLINGDEVLAVPMEDKTFNFSSHERLTGRWTMPKGFTPQFIEVRLSGSTPVTKRFSWQRGKEVAMPSSTISEIPQAKANVK